MARRRTWIYTKAMPWTRRRWIKTALAGSAGLALARFAGAGELGAATETSPVERWVELFNTHTSETFRAVYRKGSDFDSIYVVTVQRDGGKTVASFRHEQQQLNGQAAACPKP